MGHFWLQHWFASFAIVNNCLYVANCRVNNTDVNYKTLGLSVIKSYKHFQVIMPIFSVSIASLTILRVLIILHHVTIRKHWCSFIRQEIQILLNTPEIVSCAFHCSIFTLCINFMAALSALEYSRITHSCSVYSLLQSLLTYTECSQKLTQIFLFLES
jgi:hypothetical protein